MFNLNTFIYLRFFIAHAIILVNKTISHTSAIVRTFPDDCQTNTDYLMGTLLQPKLLSPRRDKIKCAMWSKCAMGAVLHGRQLHRVD